MAAYRSRASRSGRKCPLDEGLQVLDRCVAERRTGAIVIAGNESGYRVTPRGVIDENHPLSADWRAPQHIADFESHAIARTRRFRDQDIAGREPFQIAPEHLTFGQQSLRIVHVIGQQMGREHRVAQGRETFADRTASRDTAAIAPDGKVLSVSGVKDGPFVETKEVIGGFMVVAADSYEQAVEIARGCPGVVGPGLSTEIREIAGP